MNKVKFRRNAFGIQVKLCCASCAYKCLTRSVSQRVCTKHNKEVRACEVCECWKMSGLMKSFCKSDGEIKRREYQLYLMNIRKCEAENGMEERSIEDIRREFESQFGSIYINL